MAKGQIRSNREKKKPKADRNKKKAAARGELQPAAHCPRLDIGGGGKKTS